MNHAMNRVGLGLAAWAVLVAGACTAPPTFSDATNNFVSFNPVFIDSLPGTTRALQVTGFYDEDGFVVLQVSQAEFDALPRLWAYQLWALSTSGSAITSKKAGPKFLWDPVRHVALQPDGQEISPRKFNFQTDITAYQRLVLTIEPYPDYFFIPASGLDTAKTIFVDDGVTTGNPTPDLEFLTVDLHSAGTRFNMRFATANQFDTDTGTFFLANYTGGPGVPAAVSNSANYGIWFGKRILGGGIEPSLTLPALPAGWIYEGWIIPPSPNPAFPISTGRFSQVDTQDLSARFSGDFSGAFTLPLPGEDFLQNAPSAQWTFPMNMVSPVGDTGWAFITVEPNYQPFAGLDPQDPSPDIDANPFFYRLLQSPLPDVAHAPSLNPNLPENNTFILQNMHGKSPKFGHPGAPLLEIQLSSE